MSYVLSLRRHFPNHDISKCCGYWPRTSSHKCSSWDHPSFSTPWCLFRCGQTNCTTLRQRGSMWTMVCLPQFPWLPLCTPWWILTKNTMFFYWSPPLRLNLWCYQHRCLLHATIAFLFFICWISTRCFPPPPPLLLLLEVGMLLGTGVFIFVVVTSHICFEGGQTMMVCLESYAVSRMSYNVLGLWRLSGA